MINENVTPETVKRIPHRPLVGPLVRRWREADRQRIHELAAVYPEVAAKVIDVFEALDAAGMPPVVYEDYPVTFPMMEQLTGIDTLAGQGEVCRALVEELMTNHLPTAPT